MYKHIMRYPDSDKLFICIILKNHQQLAPIFHSPTF